jgi:microsomal dipeptidase-like Zn-dependent dipeptidase
VATTAVVAGTAGAVAHRQQQRWANQAADQQAQVQAQQQQAEVEEMQRQMEAMQAQQVAAAAAAPAAAAAAPAGAGPDLMTQLNQLAQLHQAGALTDEEFAAAKAKLLS